MRFTNKWFDKCCATSMQTPKNAKTKAMNTCFFGYRTINTKAAKKQNRACISLSIPWKMRGNFSMKPSVEIMPRKMISNCFSRFVREDNFNKMVIISLGFLLNCLILFRNHHQSSRPCP